MPAGRGAHPAGDLALTGLPVERALARDDEVGGGEQVIDADRLEGEVDPDIDPVLPLFFCWLVYMFRNKDQTVAT